MIFKNKKLAIITGGTRGIGLACATILAEKGYNLAICSRNLKDLKKVSDHFKKNFNIICYYKKVDVSKINQINSFVNLVYKKFHRIDILINNAGIQLNKKLELIEVKNHKKIIDNNLSSYFFFTNFVGKYMIKKKHGIIINISSVLSKFPLVGRGLYSISKAGIDSLTRSTALEWSKYNIVCNSINPGHIETDLIRRDIKKKLINISEMKKRSVVGKIGTVENISNFAYYLIKNNSIYQTGQSFFIDGGFSIKK